MNLADRGSQVLAAGGEQAEGSRRLISMALDIDPGQGSGGDGAHDVGLGQEADPDLAAGFHDGGVVVPDLETEPVLAKILPDVLDGVVMMPLDCGFVLKLRSG